MRLPAKLGTVVLNAINLPTRIPRYLEPAPPLILTLQLSADAQAFFDALRQRHFPPERNFLKAHLTLFHHLPNTPTIMDQIAAAARMVPAPLLLAVSGLQKLGNGVAYRIECADLIGLHRRLQKEWDACLKPQDRQPLRPHVTIQNKVQPSVAAALYQQLSEDFRPFEAAGTGLQLWAYLNGPWGKVAEYSFIHQ